MSSTLLDDPLLATYALAASLMILKTASMAWLTVLRMTQVKGGFRAPEDLRQTRLNPQPDPKQLEPNEAVERVRRIHQNDLENIPIFLAAGYLYILTAPPLWLAQVLLYGYVVTRALHFVAYLTAQTHDVRAAMWTPGSLIILFMAGRVALAAVGV
jgi:glutathione S-transferase